jgi:hypothetical protein
MTLECNGVWDRKARRYAGGFVCYKGVGVKQLFKVVWIAVIWILLRSKFTKFTGYGCRYFKSSVYNIVLNKPISRF